MASRLRVRNLVRRQAIGIPASWVRHLLMHVNAPYGSVTYPFHERLGLLELHNVVALMKPHLPNTFGAMVLAAVLVSCATGRDFVRPEPGSLSLGETELSDIETQYGDPFTRSSKVYQETKITELLYAYGAGDQEPNAPDVVPSRLMTFYLKDEVLVGYYFSSSFKSDHTDFDEKRRNTLKHGLSCKIVEDVFGSPNFEYMHPMTAKKGMMLIGYKYHQNYSTDPVQEDMYTKTLSVACDDSNNIFEVEYTETGQR